MEYGYEIQNVEHELCMVDFLMTVSRELSKYKLDLVVLQVRWEGGRIESEGEYTFFYRKGNENHE
jgi:hypothetical protein